MRCVTPTGWTLSEMFLLLRDCLVREEGDTLVLGLGVPSGWLDKPFAVANLPTHFGRVSYRYDPAERTVTASVERPPAGGIRSAFAPACGWSKASATTSMRKTQSKIRKDTTVMPGYATWRTLYHDEYRQLREEGYAVGDKLKSDMDSEFLPFPADVRAAHERE